MRKRERGSGGVRGVQIQGFEVTGGDEEGRGEKLKGACLVTCGNEGREGD